MKFYAARSARARISLSAVLLAGTAMASAPAIAQDQPADVTEEDGDEIVADLNTNELNCIPLQDPAIVAERKAKWEQVVADNGGIHPNCGEANTRLLNRMRRLAVPAIQGSGMHPDRQLWVNNPREPEMSSFEPTNKYR